MLALSRYARSAEQGRAGYRYSVTVDGVVRGGGAAGILNAGRAAGVQVPVASLHRGSASSLVIARQPDRGNLGLGSLFWVAQLRYYLRADTIAARDEGVAIGRTYLELSGRPLKSVSAGTTLMVRLTVTTGQMLSHLQIDDPIPAGFEPLDQSLNTSRQGFDPLPPNGARSTDLATYLDHSDLRDDRVSLFAGSLPPGTYTYTYLARATVSGRYAVAPVRAVETLFPEVFGRGSGQIVTVN